ncbi:shikimate kinase, partial [Actinomyces sp. ICM47]
MSLIVLIGVTGSGKTTVGRELSLRYELPLYEVDEAVEARLGAPMRTLV